VVVLEGDETLVEIHSEEAAPHFKGGCGFHPPVATCDSTGEVLVAELRLGNAGANCTVDQLVVVDRRIAAPEDVESATAAVTILPMSSVLCRYMPIRPVRSEASCRVYPTPLPPNAFQLKRAGGNSPESVGTTARPATRPPGVGAFS